MSEIANYFLYRNAEGETSLSANSIDDLNLDDLFAEIDYCHSSIGRQYLYYLLLSDKTSGMYGHENEAYNSMKNVCLCKPLIIQ